MNAPRRIYLDNAATSWPKPEAVYAAVDRYQRENGAPAGRSGYHEAAEAGRIVSDLRRRLAEFIEAPSGKQIVFGQNGTDCLNLALHGLLRAGDHVVTTVAEHNSVLRPLRTLEETGGVSVTRVACDGSGMVDPGDIAAAITENTRLVAVVHASNVTGAVQPVTEIARAAHERGALVLVDACQTLGHRPLSVLSSEIDLLAASGHKGLLGPLGTGLLYIRAGLEVDLEPRREGGTGTRSEEDRQPSGMPEKFESGNLNMPGLAGLAAGLAWLRDQGLHALHRRQQRLEELLTGLREIHGVRVYGPEKLEDRVGVVSFTLEGFDPQEIASTLDSVYRIQVRPGLHCAPRMHEALGTLNRGGTVRLSVGPYTTPEDTAAVVAALGEISSAAL